MKEYITQQLPAFGGKARQLPWPWFSMKAMSFWSSSGVHGPFLSPVFSQHGGLPIFLSCICVAPEKEMM